MLIKSLVLIIYFIAPLKVRTASNTDWGWGCPFECECQIVSTEQTHLLQWKPPNSTVKTALCVLTSKALPAIYAMPSDTECITILQANDDNDMKLASETLQIFPHIKAIDLQGSLEKTQIQISNELFHGLEELKYLSLQRVDMAGAQKALAKLSSLEVLYVIHCDIGFLKWEMLDGLKNLKELYLQESGIKELYGFAFYGTPELRRLFLSHNDLFSVEADAFVGLLKLEYLDLSNNRIEHLSGLTFPPLPHLQYLELKHNPIKVIFPHCFQFLNGTQHLTLGHEKQPVHLMKFSFRGLSSLLYLHIPNIDNDALFEHMFYELHSLKHLNLRGRIKLINNRAFIGAHKVLEKLILQSCQLERIFPDSFNGLAELHVLDLSNNNLKSLPDNIFEPLESIQHILLHNNRIKSLADGIFLPLHSLKSLSLYDNQWECSCKMQFWSEKIVLEKYEPYTKETCNDTICILEGKRENEVDFMPKCENPEELRGSNIFDALKTFECIKFQKDFK